MPVICAAYYHRLPVEDEYETEIILSKDVQRNAERPCNGFLSFLWCSERGVLSPLDELSKCNDDTPRQLSAGRKRLQSVFLCLAIIALRAIENQRV